MRKQFIAAAFPALGMLLLIIDAKTAAVGALDGIALCLQTVIPSLFPFFVLSILLSSAVTGLKVPFAGGLCKLCRIPAGCEGIFITGLLGGYPVGAQSTAQAYASGQISRNDAVRMLGFCSNAGLSFLFGIVAAKFSSPWIAVLIWAIHIISAISAAMILPGTSSHDKVQLTSKKVTLTHAVDRSVRITARVCGWIILFRIVISFLQRWFFWLLPVESQVAISGLIELANGCCRLHEIKNEGMRMIIASGMLSLGGISVVMQTASVTGELGLGMYLPGKAFQCLTSIFLSAILASVLYQGVPSFIPAVLAGCTITAGILLILLEKGKIKYSIRHFYGV